MHRAHHHRSGFTLIELFALIAVIGVLLALILPAIQASRESQRRTQCVSNLKQIGLAILNYADKIITYPPISSNTDLVPDVPGDSTASSDGNSRTTAVDSSGAGYSWIVQILPEFQEVALYESIRNNSREFTLAAFNTAVQLGAGGRKPHCATQPLSVYICPSFTGGRAVDTSPRTAGTIGGTIETGNAPRNYVGGVGTANGAKGIAITNYNAILGTHIDSVSKSASDPNNGGMQFRGTVFTRGLRPMTITDGVSKTPLVAETRERRFSSWYDGTMNWVVAARHSNPPAGTKAITAASKNYVPRVGGMPMNDRWTVGSDGTWTNGGSSLNYGPTAANPTAVYLPTGALSDPDIFSTPPGRLWGPSSQHKGGIVNHVFGDAHVESISDGIDANVYLWIVTRNGGEALPQLSGD